MVGYTINRLVLVNTVQNLIPLLRFGNTKQFEEESSEIDFFQLIRFEIQIIEIIF